MQQKLVLILLLLLGFLPPSPAGADVARAKLNGEDLALVKQIEDYLNEMRTVKARFLQITSEGGFAEGDFYLSRPGRLRIEYDPPMPVLIVADGAFLVYYDRELKQVSHLGLDSTPAGILVAERISLFSGDLIITGFEREAGAARLTVVRAADPLEGTLTLVFSEAPLALKKWLVTDAQGVVTTISLMGAEYGVELDPELFKFKAPKIVNPMY